ncbi:hypothetical protein [Paraburkholderia sp. RL17-337-BIB-A]|uniref:hypothetical protein n=1 Tax=Paraburkholderia sp. RL17-337-BIB-A TaxID=3031636 RepID=UPI0038BC5597
MKLLHGTDAVFERFSMDHSARPGISGNSFLGVWLAVQPDLALRYGERCLEVDADVGNAYAMPLSELAALNSRCRQECADLFDERAIRELEREFYTKVRKQLLADGCDTIEVKELRSRVDIVITLDPQRLTILDARSREDMAEPARQ